MNLRDVKKAKTAQKIRAAMERIIKGTPTNRILKKRTNLKLNPSTVEQESGLGVGALRHHDQILKEIISYNSHDGDSEDPNNSEMNTGLQKMKNEKLKQQKKKALKGKHEAENKNQSQKETINKLKRENKSLHKHHTEVVSALFYLIPQAERKDLFEKKLILDNANVTPIK